jgi:hypothetical protein
VDSKQLAAALGRQWRPHMSQILGLLFDHPHASWFTEPVTGIEVRAAILKVFVPDALYFVCMSNLL